MDNNTNFSWERFEKAPIVGIIRGMSREKVTKMAVAYNNAGLYALEVTMNTERATDIIDQLSKNHPDLCIGAGTVCAIDQLQLALEAGAKFIVTPVLNEEVTQSCVKKGIPIFPGALTPTEIYKAWTLGATAVKVFPAQQMGASYIKNVLAPLNDIKLLPTGGVSLQNIESYFKAGAVGVGMGSSLFDKQLIEKGDYDSLEKHFQYLLQTIQTQTLT